jgi:hypothetical protein
VAVDADARASGCGVGLNATGVRLHARDKHINTLKNAPTP